MRTITIGCLLAAAGLFALASCGKKENPVAPPRPSVPAEARALDVPASTLAAAFLKDLAKAKAEYEGKEAVVRNLLAYQPDGTTHVVSSCAFDPQSKIITTKIASRYQKQDLVGGEEFNIDVEFADPAEFDTIKEPSNATVGEKTTTVFESLYSVKGTIRHEGSDNGFAVKKARLVK